jgi:hypothetical protein
MYGAECLLRSHSCSATQEILRVLWNLKVHYHVNKSSLMAAMLSQMNQVNTPLSPFFNIHFSLLSLFWKKNKIKGGVWEHLTLCVCNPLSLLGNGSVNTFPAATNTRNDTRIVLRVVFYAVRVVSKENRRLVLLRTSCDIILASTSGYCQ